MQNKASHIFLRLLLSVFTLSFSCFVAPAQWYDPDKVNPKAGELYGKAYEEATSHNYAEAIRLLDDALKLEPKFVDVFLSR
ncbi:MAG TPA: hypothetical protein PKC51_05300, partial [Ferruginibacter sp.]|nr:hypothetical protein [Ferruginibacter sp.]